MGSSDCFMIQSCKPLHKTRFNHEWISETSCRTKLVVHFVQLVPVLHAKDILPSAVVNNDLPKLVALNLWVLSWQRRLQGLSDAEKIWS